MRWIVEAVEGFPDDEDGDDEERGGIDERGEDLSPKVAEGAGGGGGARGEPDGEEGERESGGVGRHVTGIGKESERVRQDTADDLDEEKNRRNGKREGDRATAGCRSRIVD